MKSSLVLGMGVVLSLGVTACGGNNNGPALEGGKLAPKCPSPETVQCGYGCVAATTTCCNSKQYSPEWDIGTFECPGATVAQCVANTGACGASQYCCSTSGSFSSIECKDGTVVCNQNCVPVGSTCCSMKDPTNCGTVGGVVATTGGGGATSGNCKCWCDHVGGLQCGTSHPCPAVGGFPGPCAMNVACAACDPF